MSSSGVGDYSGALRSRPNPYGTRPRSDQGQARPLAFEEEGATAEYQLWDPGVGGGGPSVVQPSPQPNPFDGAQAGGEVGRPCDLWIYYDAWFTQQDERVCPECGPLHGRWFKVGEGPYPPLHDHCRCQRRLIYWECFRSSDGSRGGEGGFNY